MANPHIRFESFSYLANIFYTSIGLDVYDKPGECSNSTAIQLRRRQLLSIFFAITIINMNIGLLSEFMFIFMAFVNNNHFVDAIVLAAFMGFAIVGDFKIYSIWRQRAHITALMRNLYALYPQTPEEQSNYDVKLELQHYKRYVFALIMFFELSYWSYSLFPLLSYLINDILLGVRGVDKTLPYNCWMPFEWQTVNWRYYLMYLSQIAAGQACLSAQLANDLLLSAVAVQLFMHYRQLAKKIESHRAGLTTGIQWKETTFESSIDLQFLREVIAYHQKVLCLSQGLNEVFGISLFISFASTSIIICFVLFQITISASVDVMIMLTFFLFCSLVQIFILCYYAQKLLEASEYIRHAIYNHNWFDADLRYKKMLVLIMKRAQKPAKMQATSFVTISLSTMTILLQLSYKGLAVIRTMYARDPKDISKKY